MKSSVFGPIGIHRPERYAAGVPQPYNAGDLVDSELWSPIDVSKPGQRKVKKVKRPEILPAGAYGPAQLKDVVIGGAEPGLSFGPFGVNIGTKEGRKQQASGISDRLTPEVSQIMKAKGIDKAVELINLTPRLVKYGAGEITAMNLAHLALPGFAGPVLGPIIVGDRIYRAAFDKRTDFEIFINGSSDNDTFRNRMLLAGTNVVMAPFDLTTTILGQTTAFALNFLAGRTILNRIPGSLAKLDPELKGLEPVDSGITHETLTAVEKISNLLSFGQPAALTKAA